MPFRIEPTDLLIIAIVALLIFGPSRLPEIGRAIGRTLKEFQAATKEATQGFAEEVSKAESQTGRAETHVQILWQADYRRCQILPRMRRGTISNGGQP